MSESREMRPRIRRPAIGLTLVAMTGLAAVCIFARCSGGQSVTPEALAAARKVWAEAGIRDYDLEWSASGITSARLLRDRAGARGTQGGVDRIGWTEKRGANPRTQVFRSGRALHDHCR